MDINKINLDSLLNEFNHIFRNYSAEDLTFINISKDILNYYESIISCMPGNVYWLDKDGRALGCNKNVLDMMGLLSIEKFRGLTFEEMGRIGKWSEPATQSFKKDTLEVIRTGQAKFNVEELVIPHLQTHQDIYFLTSRVPLFNQNKEVIGVVGISIDITERKKMEEKLKLAKEQAEENLKIKDQFIRNMEHDIRTPFNGIWGMTGYLYEIEENPEKREMLGDIVASAKELMDFCDHLLDFAKTSKGDLPIFEKKFHLKNLFEGILNLQKPAVMQKNLLLKLEYDSNLPECLIGDDYRIQRILINLISNAIKFTEQGSIKIIVSAKSIEKNICLLSIKIEDTGIGIPLEKQDFIFEKFGKLNESNQMIYPGIGLGLRVVKQFMEELKGKLKLVSEVGKGTSFSLLIPYKLPLV